MNRRLITPAILGLALLAACKKEEVAPLWEPVAVTRRDITVSAEAAGTIEPILVVDVKSRASGTILQMRAETGDIVRQGDTLVLVDRRDPTNTLNQAQADLEVARAQLANAESQKRRIDQMFQQQLVSEQEQEAAALTYANARAQLVRAETQVQTARDALDDTSVRAPISGVIIAKNVEVGNVIASATRDVTGGVVLLRMADLSVVQVRTLVDETDIGKLQPGMRATITVDAFPNRPFEGTVLKIEPQSTTNQNVTMFPVLIRIANENGLLRPGMSAEVAIQVASRTNVLAIPNAALRTQRDVNSAAQVLGLDPDEVQAALARADSIAGPSAQGQMASGGGSQRSQGGDRTTGIASPRTAEAQQVPAVPQPDVQQPPPQAPAAGAGTGPGMGGAQGGQGFRPPLPDGVTEEQWNAIRAKRQAGEALTPAESTIAAQVRAAFQQRMAQQGAPGAAPGGTGQAPQGAPAAGAAPMGGGTTAAAAGGAGGSGGASGFASMLPAGVSEEQARSIMQRGFSGGNLSAEERAIFNRIRQSFSQMSSGSSSQRRRFGAGNSFQFGGSYIVFKLDSGQPAPARIRTGVTDMDYSEVLNGLTEQDSVVLLPSQSLVQAQQEMRDRMSRFGGGAVPGMRQTTSTGTTRTATTGTGGGGGGAPAGPPPR
jgi:HlyD family secretion protein